MFEWLRGSKGGATISRREHGGAPRPPARRLDTSGVVVISEVINPGGGPASTPTHPNPPGQVAGWGRINELSIVL